jgi:hypothetical protein
MGTFLQVASGAGAVLAQNPALAAAKWRHKAGTSSRVKIAATGQTVTHAPQSMHSSGLM